VIAREALVAGVLAATDKVVQRAYMGDWQAARQSSNDRRLLLEQLTQQEPQAGEHGFLRALREAAAESDAALAQMSSISKTNSASTDGPSGTLAAGNRLCSKV
jgi:hypothetical protein